MANYTPNNTLPHGQLRQHAAGIPYGQSLSYHQGQAFKFQGMPQLHIPPVHFSNHYTGNEDSHTSPTPSVPQQHVPIQPHNYYTGNHPGLTFSSQRVQRQHVPVQPYNHYVGYQQGNTPVFQGGLQQGLAGQPYGHYTGFQQSYASPSQGAPQQHVAVNIHNHGKDLQQRPVFGLGHYPPANAGPFNNHISARPTHSEFQAYRPSPINGFPDGLMSFAGKNTAGGYEGFPTWPLNQTRHEETVEPSRKRGFSEMSGPALLGTHQKAVKNQVNQRKLDDSTYQDAHFLDESFYNQGLEQVHETTAVLLESNESSEQVNAKGAALAYDPDAEQFDNDDFALSVESLRKPLQNLDEGARLVRTQLPYIGVLPEVQSGFSPLTKHHLTAKWHKWSQKRQEKIAWREITESGGTIDLIQRHIAVIRTRSAMASLRLDLMQPLSHFVLSRHMAFALLWYLERCGVDSCDSYLGKLVAKYSRDEILKPFILCFKRLDSDAERGFLLLQRPDDQPELGTIEERLATVLRRIKEQHVPPFTKLETSFEEWRRFREMYFGDGQEKLGGQTDEGDRPLNQEYVPSQEDVNLLKSDLHQEGAQYDAAMWTKDKLYY